MLLHIEKINEFNLTANHLRQLEVLPMLPNSLKQAFEPRNFSNRSNDEPSRTTTTTDAYFSVSVSAYSADVKL